MAEQIIMVIIGTVFTAVIGGLQYKMNKLEQRIEDKISRKEVRELIQDKLEVVDVKIEAISEDLNLINTKLDKIIELR